MKILVDTREQRPFAFSGCRHYEGVTLEAAPLMVGDYSLPGLTDKIAVERKELPDLVQCLARERDRFERELARARGLEAFMVVVEASFADLTTGAYRSRLNPHAAAQSVLAFQNRYRAPFFFAGSRPLAEYAAWSFLRQYLLDWQKRAKAVEKSLKESAA